MQGSAGPGKSVDSFSFFVDNNISHHYFSVWSGAVGGKVHVSPVDCAKGQMENKTSI